jgi:hypothetical protein
MRRDDRRKDFRVDGSMFSAVIVAIHAAHYTTIPMRKNMTLPKPLWRKTVRQRLVAVLWRRLSLSNFGISLSLWCSTAAPALDCSF